MGIYEILAVVPWVMGIFGAFVPVLVYLVSRWREDKGGPPDPMLGFASIYGFIAYIGYSVVTIALGVLLGDVFDGGSTRLGAPAALIISGAVVFAAGFFAVKAKTASAPSRASRLYVGLAALSASLVSAVLFIAVAVMIAADTGGRSMAQPIAFLIVNLPLAIVGAVVIGKPRAAPDHRPG